MREGSARFKHQATIAIGERLLNSSLDDEKKAAADQFHLHGGSDGDGCKFAVAVWQQHSGSSSNSRQQQQQPPAAAAASAGGSTKEPLVDKRLLRIMGKERVEEILRTGIAAAKAAAAAGAPADDAEAVDQSAKSIKPGKMNPPTILVIRRFV